MKKSKFLDARSHSLLAAISVTSLGVVGRTSCTHLCLAERPLQTLDLLFSEL